MNDLTAQVNEAIFCPLCDTKGLFVYKGLQGKLLSVPGSWDLLECANELCGLAWLFPRPTGGAIKRLYETYYTHGGAVDPRQRFDIGHRRKSISSQLRRWLRIDVARENAELMYLDKAPPGRLLDVGCGDGGRLGAAPCGTMGGDDGSDRCGSGDSEAEDCTASSCA